MNVVERKPRSREHTRVNIIATAKDIARREGWPAVSIRKIADAVEFSAPIVYEYFASKDLLLAEIRNEGFQTLLTEYGRILKLYRDPEKRLYEISLFQWQFAQEFPEIYAVMYNQNGAFCGISCTQSAPMLAIQTVISDVIFSFIPKSQESIRKLYFEWWATSHGIISLAALLTDTPTAEHAEPIYRDTMRRFVRSLR
jgi:AcrR family transcriptional regulator